MFAITWFCLRLQLNNTTVALAYLLAVLAVAARWGLPASASMSLVAVATFNYYFLPPVRTFTIADPQNWVALVAFLATAIFGSHLSDRASKRAAEAVQRRQEMERLYDVSRAVMLSASDQPAAAQIAGYVARIFGSEAVGFYDRETDKIWRAGSQDLRVPDSKLKDTALQAIEFHDSSTNTMVVPVSLGGHAIGSIAASGGALSEAALHAIANLAAIAIQKEQAQAAANLSEAARHSEALKSTLLDAVAHEFKTPLTSIKAATSTLLFSDAQNESQHELLTVIDEETDRLSDLVTDAIQMARIEAGKLRLDKKPLAVAQLIEEAVEKLRPLMPDRTVEVNAAEDLPMLEADPDLVLLVLRQLLSNAMKYSPPGSPITVRASLTGDDVAIAVSDHGYGIPEYEQAHIFDKFYRAANVRAHIPGTGMGLSIARQIVEAHGGRIWVSSHMGRGSTFSLTLPLVTAPISK